VIDTTVNPPGVVVAVAGFGVPSYVWVNPLNKMVAAALLITR